MNFRELRLLSGVIFNNLRCALSGKITVGELFTGWVYKRNWTIFFHPLYSI